MELQGIIMSILAGAIGCICYFLKELKDSIKDKIKDNYREIQKTQADLQNMKNALPHTYVFRDDFLRAISNLDTKVDRVAADVARINENVAKLVTGGERA